MRTEDDQVFSLEQLLQDHHLSADRLVKAGCDRIALRAILALAPLTDDSWEKLLEAKDARQVRGWINQIRQCANLVERLNRSLLIYQVSIAAPNPRFAMIHQPPTLPERLRNYADGLDWLRRIYGPKRRILRTTWKAHLVAFVLESTKRPHDAEVCELIGAVLQEDKSSDAETHKRWRLKHNSLISVARRKVRQHRPFV